MAEFDIAVIMGSQSDTVFDEYCAMHRGIKRLRKMWEERCECDDPTCFRSGMQELSYMVHDDAELVRSFIDGFEEGFEPLEFKEFDEALLRMYAAASAKHGSLRRATY